MMENWIPVDIRHKQPVRLANASGMGERLLFGDDDVSAWLADNRIPWSYAYSDFNTPMPRLCFCCEQHAMLFKLRWS